MKGWIKKGIITIAAAAAFPAMLYVVLAMQGRLTSPDIETLRHLPLVGNLLPAAEETPPATVGPEIPKPASDPRRPKSDDWRDAVEIDDPEVLLQELKARREVYDAKLDELVSERKELERLRSELDDREDILARLQDQIEMSQADLAREREKLDARGALIDAGTARALKDTAKTIAEMDSEKAAEALAGLEEDRAARLLKVMDASAAASILSEMRDADRRKTLIEKLTLLQTEPKPSTGGK